MSKSSYPNKIDSSVELPIVRNNVTEINADLLNSLRDAIIQIEKTLGVNPQGISSVSERLSSSLDLTGEIKKDALDKAGVIYGPIINENIAKTAGIDESKLKLNFPTQVLQTEVSLLKNELENFTDLIEEISAKLSSHLNTSSLARHNSDNIYVDQINVTASSTATSGFDGGTLTNALKDIYDNHIGFSGEVAQDNNSHSASQIYFDNTSVVDLITTSDVQSAIETLADQKTEALKTNLFSTNSNGIIRQSKYFDIINNVVGKLKLDYTGVSYTASTAQNQVILFSSPVTPIYDINKFDLLEITSGVDEGDDRKYLIVDFELISGDISTITILGGTKYDSGINSEVRILKNPYQYSNLNAYNTTVRPRYNRTNTPDIIVAHPNCATIISKNITPEKINSVAANLGVEIDGTSYDIPVYNALRGSTNTLDEIILNINEYCSDNKVPLFAYKYKNISCYEVAISHVIPSWIDSSTNRYLKIVSASSSDASSPMGMDSFLDEEIYGSYGNSILINGNTLSDNDSIISYLGSDLTLNVGTNNITFEVINPIIAGIKVGNLCYIEDNGLYRVSSLTTNSISLDSQGTTFTADIDSDKKVYIYKSTICLEDLEFSEIVGSDGSIILDLFMTEDFDYGYHIRAKIEGNLQDGSLDAIIFDISKGYLVNQTDTISIDTSGLITVFDGTSMSDGDQIYSSGEYIARSPSGSSFYRLSVLGTPPLTSLISATATGYEELPFNLIPLSRCVYSTAFGFVIGESDIGVPVVIDKRPSGTTNEAVISPSIIEKYISGPRGELRDDGYVSGLSFSITDETATTCNISVNPGFYYNSGIRYKFDGVVSLPVDHGGISFFVGFDSSGCLRVGIEITDPLGSGTISPFYAEKIVYIGYFIVDGSGTVTNIDLRKNISFLDRKINQIIVAEEKYAGHFTDLKKAVDYARYYKMFSISNAIPSILIKNGTYQIDETIVLDFDIQISGSGPSTVLVQGSSLVSSNSSETLSIADYQSAMFLIGSEDESVSNQSSNFEWGVRISNLTCQASGDLDSATDSNFNFFFLITQALDASGDKKSFRFDNINFNGSDQMSESSTNSAGSLDGVRQIIPIVIGLASDVIASSPENYGMVFVSNCSFNYSGTGWSAVGAIISKIGTYYIRSCNVSGNILRNASPTQNKVTAGSYYIFNSSSSYVMSGPPDAGITINMVNISVAANSLAD